MYIGINYKSWNTLCQIKAIICLSLYWPLPGVFIHPRWSFSTGPELMRFLLIIQRGASSSWASHSFTFFVNGEIRSAHHKHNTVRPAYNNPHWEMAKITNTRMEKLRIQLTYLLMNGGMFAKENCWLIREYKVMVGLAGFWLIWDYINDVRFSKAETE